MLYISASSPDGDVRLAGKSVQHFCRSIELCEDYLRGFYGLALVCMRSNAISAWLTTIQASAHLLETDRGEKSDPAVLSKKTLGRLKSFALQRLREIVQSRSVNEQHWASSRSELIAAQAILNRFES